MELFSLQRRVLHVQQQYRMSALRWLNAGLALDNELDNPIIDADDVRRLIAADQMEHLHHIRISISMFGEYGQALEQAFQNLSRAGNDWLAHLRRHVTGSSAEPFGFMDMLVSSRSWNYFMVCLTHHRNSLEAVLRLA